MKNHMAHQMDDETATKPISPGYTLRDITKRLQTMRVALETSTASTPGRIVEELNHIIHKLGELSQQVIKTDEEHRDLLALADISQVVNSSLQLNDVLRIVMDTIIRLTGAERGFLMLLGKSGDLTIRIARNWEQESIRPVDFAVSRTIINQVASTGKPIVTTNAQSDPRFSAQDSIIAFSLRSILCVPLKVKKDLIGVIYADNRVKSGIFTPADRDLLTAFANQAAIAIDNAQLFESVQHTLAEVTELKNMMDNIFSSIASGVITADIEEKITLCNKAAERILGANSQELVGRNLQDCLPPLADKIISPLRKVRQTDQPVLALEIQPVIPDRGAVDLVLNISPLKDADQTTQGVAIVLDDLTEKKRLEAQRQLFERMVPPQIIEQLELEKIQLGGERVEITTLFADLRDFTSFSEAVEPEQLVTILNQYLSAAAEAVLSQGGTLDKFMGDAVMAIFNAPIPQPNHTLRAVKAALSLRDAIHELYRKLPPAFHLGFGVGIHSGDAVLGLVGSEKRLDYTAIGDSVNTAKRIQENAAEGQILISEEAWRNTAEWLEVRPVSPIHAKGKSKPVKVFEVLSAK